MFVVLRADPARNAVRYVAWGDIIQHGLPAQAPFIRAGNIDKSIEPTDRLAAGVVAIGGVFIRKCRDESAQAFQRTLGDLGRVRLDAFDRGGRFPSLELPVFQARDIGLGDAGVHSCGNHGGFQRQLRCRTSLDRLSRRHRAGLVVDHGNTAIVIHFQPIRLGVQRETAAGAIGEGKLSGGLGVDRAQTLASLVFLLNEPGSDTLEPPPPERGDRGAFDHRSQNVPTHGKQLFEGIVRQGDRMRDNKALQCIMDEAAAVGRIGIFVQVVQWRKLENAAGVDRIGVALPHLYLGNRQSVRAHIQRRPWLRRDGRLNV